MSDDPSKIRDIDLDIFKDPNCKCLKPTNDSLITEMCSHVKRLCAASRYFDLLNSSKMKKKTKQSLFVQFNEEIYQNALDDTVHFIKEHEGDIKRIHREWVQNYSVPNCTVSDCVKTARHYTRSRRADEKKEKGNDEEADALYNFYESLYDRLHHFVAHLYDIGLRVDTESLMKDVVDDEKEDALNGVTVDKLFAATRDVIQSKRDQSEMDFERLDDQNNKFLIQTETKKTAKTVFDVIFEKLSEDLKVDTEILVNFKEFLDENHFDSDGVEQDVEDEADSNINHVLSSESAFETVSKIINAIKCMSLYVLCRFQFIS